MKHFRNWKGATALAGLSPLPLVSAPATLRGRYTKDSFQTFDRATMDSAGAFLIGELERLDPMIHEPLVSVTWARDIDLRTDVQMGDTSSSYTVSTFGAPGNIAAGGINWSGSQVTANARAQLDIAKIVNPLNLWDMEVAYTIPELESARLTGRPIDTQMLSALNLKHQMDIDQMVYIGDSTLSMTGLFNNASVTNVADVATGAAGSKTFAAKSADEIRSDVNELLVSVWAASGYVAPPTKLALSPTTFGDVSTRIASEAANTTILEFLKANNVLTAEKGIPLDIVPVKWLATANRSGATSDRMVAYSQRADYVRYPIVPLQPATTQFQGIWIKVPYYGRLGVVEMVYPETIGYRDGIA